MILWDIAMLSKYVGTRFSRVSGETFRFVVNRDKYGLLC